MAVMDSYSEANGDGGVDLDKDIDACGQSFTGNGGPVDSCEFYLKKSGTPAGNMEARVYAHTGTFGSTGKPTGAALATSGTISANSLTTSYVLTEFTFGSPYTTTNGTKYVIQLMYGDGTISNYVLVGRDASSPSHAGNLSFYAFLSWIATSSYDACFYVYTTGSASPSVSPSVSLSPSISSSTSPSVSVSPSISPSLSPSISPSLSPSISPSISPSVSPSVSLSPSISPSTSPSVSLSPSISPSLSPSLSP